MGSRDGGALARVVSAFATKTPDPAWTSSVAALETERLAIEAMLRDRPDEPVYGFSTMLGHLDRTGDLGLSQESLLAAHLVGPTSVLSGDVLRLTTLCKIEQVHHGGCGIHPQTFREVLASTTRAPASATGAWESSYGSGDVVPAAWWVRSLLADGSLGELRTGDTIVLINGSFVAATWTVVAGLQVADVAAQIIAAATVMCRLPRSSPLHVDGLAHPIVRAFREAQESGAAYPWDRSGQAPVTLRDGTPLVQAALSATDQLGRALDAVLGGPSANPRFLDVDGAMVAESQSSFLDQRVTFALTGVSQLLQLVTGVAQRFLEHRTASLQRAAAFPEPALVQPPKVASALLEQVSVLGAPNLRFVGADSEGIEDLRDGALLAARHVLRQVEIVRDALDLLDAFVEVDHGVVDTVRATVLESFLGKPGVNFSDLRGLIGQHGERGR